MQLGGLPRGKDGSDTDVLSALQDGSTLALCGSLSSIIICSHILSAILYAVTEYLGLGRLKRTDTYFLWFLWFLGLKGYR